MKKFILIMLATLMLLPMCFAQDGKVVRRIRIHSADPYFIALMLKGNKNFNAQPEYSTIIKNNGGGSGHGG
jgi:hypothetical protein